MTKIYLAGSLFKEADIKQRVFEANRLRELGFEVYNPIEAPINNKNTLPTPLAIFTKDYIEIHNSNIMVVCLDDVVSGNDMGVAVELGIAYEIGLEIYAVLSDIRMKTSNQYDITPIGINHFLLGLLKARNVNVSSSFEELLINLKEV